MTAPDNGTPRHYRECVSWSGADGWRHAMRAETFHDPMSLCGKSRNDGQWAMHVAEPSCPDCLALIEATE